MTHTEIVDHIKLNIQDKCPFMDAKGRCMHGCWNCIVSGVLLELLAMTDKPCTHSQTSDCPHCEAMGNVYRVISEVLQ